MKKILLCLALAMLLSVGVKAEEVKTVNAVKSSQKVSVDGKTVEIDAYNIEGSNYFKLRDVAVILSGTEKEFDVGFDKEDNVIAVLQNKPYSKASEGTSAIDKVKTKAIIKETWINLNSMGRHFYCAFIDNSNYLKLRDLAPFIGFDLSYNNINREIIIETKDTDYTEANDVNDGDDIRRLGKVGLDDVKSFNKKLKDEYKFDIEENGDKIKFYLNINGKKERFYLADYYNDKTNRLYGEPTREDCGSFYNETQENVKYIKKVNSELDKMDKNNLKVKLQTYNYIAFINNKDGKSNTFIKIYNILRDIYVTNDDGFKFPVEIGVVNTVGVPYIIIEENSVEKDETGYFSITGDTIYLGKAKGYMIDDDGNKEPLQNENLSWFTDVNTNTDILLIEYTVKKLRGRILIYLVK